ncbi:MAG TPA: hypothetical protein VFA50_01740 [Stellaceae bacterium]|nr:hypothetical protein [Stellaceae bacterium]
MSALVKVLVGPVVARDGGFAFDTFSPTEGLKRGFPYRRIDQANYDRKATLHGFHLPLGFVMMACETAADFAKRCEDLMRGEGHAAFGLAV